MRFFAEHAPWTFRQLYGEGEVYYADDKDTMPNKTDPYKAAGRKKVDPADTPDDPLDDLWRKSWWRK